MKRRPIDIMLAIGIPLWLFAVAVFFAVGHTARYVEWDGFLWILIPSACIVVAGFIVAIIALGVHIWEDSAP